MDKKTIRQLGLERRKRLSEAGRIEKDRKILTQVESLDIFFTATDILSYYSHHGEVDTISLMKEWGRRKRFYLPKLNNDESFIALPVTSLEELKPNHYGIPEPIGSLEGDLLVKEFDLILVPGVAFDRMGNRVGMGKGYYDRFLANQKNVPKIGLAYSEQVLDSVPKEPYDEPVDYLITENEIIRCKS